VYGVGEDYFGDGPRVVYPVLGSGHGQVLLEVCGRHNIS